MWSLSTGMQNHIHIHVHKTNCILFDTDEPKILSHNNAHTKSCVVYNWDYTMLYNVHIKCIYLNHKFSILINFQHATET